MRIHHYLLSSTSFLLLIGCAHVAPAELVNARTAHARAADGPAPKYTPAELHVANDSFQLAERSFSNNEDPALVRDLAYIATRQTENAESAARTIMHERGLVATELREEKLEDADARATEVALDDANEALTAEERRGVITAAALVTSKRAKADADARADKARDDLARIAAIKHDERGMVITLSGSVLFASNEYVLLPGAQAKLSQVAAALLEGDPGTSFVVSGHTDSQGKNASNQVLSLNRANAVRDYLVQHEIAADRITAEGYGEDRTVADNGSAEGRANNRRVEIVVTPAKRSSK